VVDAPGSLVGEHIYLKHYASRSCYPFTHCHLFGPRLPTTVWAISLTGRAYLRPSYTWLAYVTLLNIHAFACAFLRANGGAPTLPVRVLDCTLRTTNALYPAPHTLRLLQ